MIIKRNINKFLVYFILVFTLLSCGARKTNSNKDLKDFKQNTELINNTKIDNTTEYKGTASTKINSDILNFNIEPLNGKADFNFLYNGIEVKGTTTGKVNINNEKKNEETKIKWIQKEHYTYINNVKYNTTTRYKTIIKIKNTDKKAYPGWIIFVSGILFTILIYILFQYLYKTYLNKLKIF